MKILIIAGDDTCSNALNEFALSYNEGLKIRGYNPEIYYLNTLDKDSLCKIMSPEYGAIVGFQTNLFTLDLSEGNYVGNIIPAAKFNYILDPPASKRAYFEPRINGLTFFYHDIDYIEYLNRYFPHISAIYGPPGGGVTDQVLCEENIYNDRQYDVSFIGSYINYRTILDSLSERIPDWSDIIMAFFEYLIHNPNISLMNSIENFIKYNSLNVSKEEVPPLLEILYPAEKAARSFYRENVIKALLDNGIFIDVFSDTWKAAPFANYGKLRIHSGVSYRKSMEIMSDSKLSLNVFSWHKNSMTERIANIMLGGAACVSDRSGKLTELFDSNEILLYDLEQLEELPEKVIHLLENDDARTVMAHAGYKKAYENHRWINRVDDFIKILT